MSVNWTLWHGGVGLLNVSPNQCKLCYFDIICTPTKHIYKCMKSCMTRINTPSTTVLNANFIIYELCCYSYFLVESMKNSSNLINICVNFNYS